MKIRVVKIAILISLIFLFVPFVLAAVSENFESYATGTPANSVPSSGVTFSTGGNFEILALNIGNLSGQVLSSTGSLNACTGSGLTMTFSVPQESASFDFAVSSNPLQVIGYFSGQATINQQFNGGIGPYPNGTVSVSGVFDTLVLTSTGNCLSIDNLVSTDAPPDAEPVFLSPCPIFFDGRINNCDTGNWIVIYGHDYDSGRGLVITNTEGVHLLLVSPEQIAAVDECPESNTLIASGGGVEVYRIAGSCEYVVVGPAADGKKYYVIFDSLYANSGYSSFEE